MAEPILYSHQADEWLTTGYTWDHRAFSSRLAQVHFRRGELANAMEGIGFQAKQEAVLSTLVSDITKSSEIEGDLLDTRQVRSSVARRLGMDAAGLPNPDRHVEGVVEMMLDATQRFESPLTEERIFGWHAALFPTGYSGLHKIDVGVWRDDAEGPMQVVSGPMGHEQVHYEAPAADRLPSEMARFLKWFETEQIDPILKAAIGHLWFVTIHPLDDGNGRVGRAVMDMALARADRTSQRFYSLSRQIHRSRASYYEILERTQKRLSLDATEWVIWFLQRMTEALDASESVLHIVRSKHAFWRKNEDSQLNERQTKVVNLLLDGDFIGKLQTSKYAKLAKCSVPTAFRDLDELVAKGVLQMEGTGRATNYVLAEL